MKVAFIRENYYTYPLKNLHFYLVFDLQVTALSIFRAYKLTSKIPKYHLKYLNTY